MAQTSEAAGGVRADAESFENVERLKPVEERGIDLVPELLELNLESMASGGVSGLRTFDDPGHGARLPSAVIAMPRFPRPGLSSRYKMVYNSAMGERLLSWLGTSLADVRSFPEEARRSIGFQLRRVQQGLMPTDWKSMASVARGVLEIRIRGKLEHRVLYVAKFSEAVYVLHAFEKKSQKTSRTDIDVARQRFKALKTWRETGKED